MFFGFLLVKRGDGGRRSARRKFPFPIRADKTVGGRKTNGGLRISVCDSERWSLAGAVALFEP